jgi:hypothetical protein
VAAEKRSRKSRFMAKTTDPDQEFVLYRTRATRAAVEFSRETLAKAFPWPSEEEEEPVSFQIPVTWSEAPVSFSLPPDEAPADARQYLLAAPAPQPSENLD